MNDIHSIMKMLEAASIATVHPDPERFHRYLPDHVFDEDLSVKRNKELVKENNLAYEQEQARLRNERNELYDAANKAVIEYIAYNAHLTETGAEMLWDYVYDRYHSSFSDMVEELVDMIELHNSLAGRSAE